MLKYLLLAGALLCLLSPAEARHHRHHHHRARAAVQRGCDLFCMFGAGRVAAANPQPRQARETASYGGGQIVAHPSGCPRSAFCGCGAAVRLFGRPVRSLWLVANWFRFPRTAPAPGMAAVRKHHVMVLEADLGGGIWRVYDANSGGHLTRVHARSIAGYRIVNPNGASS